MKHCWQQPKVDSDSTWNGFTFQLWGVPYDGFYLQSLSSLLTSRDAGSTSLYNKIHWPTPYFSRASASGTEGNISKSIVLRGSMTSSLECSQIFTSDIAMKNTSGCQVHANRWTGGHTDTDVLTCASRCRHMYAYSDACGHTCIQLHHIDFSDIYMHTTC